MPIMMDCLLKFDRLCSTCTKPDGLSATILLKPWLKPFFRLVSGSIGVQMAEPQVRCLSKMMEMDFALIMTIPSHSCGRFWRWIMRVVMMLIEI